MNWIAAGSVAVGIVAGYIAWFWMTRFQAPAFTVVGLGKFLVVLFGGAAVDFVIHSLQVSADGAGQYAVGLLAGSVLYWVSYFIRWGFPPVSRRQ